MASLLFRLNTRPALVERDRAGLTLHPVFRFQAIEGDPSSWVPGHLNLDCPLLIDALQHLPASRFTPTTPTAAMPIPTPTPTPTPGPYPPAGDPRSSTGSGVGVVNGLEPSVGPGATMAGGVTKPVGSGSTMAGGGGGGSSSAATTPHAELPPGSADFVTRWLACGRGGSILFTPKEKLDRMHATVSAPKPSPHANRDPTSLCRCGGQRLRTREAYHHCLHEHHTQHYGCTRTPLTYHRPPSPPSSSLTPRHLRRPATSNRLPHLSFLASPPPSPSTVISPPPPSPPPQVHLDPWVGGIHTCIRTRTYIRTYVRTYQVHLDPWVGGGSVSVYFGSRSWLAFRPQVSKTASKQVGKSASRQVGKSASQ